MRKKSFLAGAMALAAGAMIGAVSPAPVDTQATSQEQVAKDATENGNTPTKNQPAGGLAGSAKQAARQVDVFGKSLEPRPSASGGGRGFHGGQRTWCVINRTGRFNRTTRSRRQRRKHRRA